MNCNEEMMRSMMMDMSAQEKKEMISQCCKVMSSDDTREMMSSMMAACDSSKEGSPREGTAEENSEFSGFATPEIRTLFNDWLLQVKAEMQSELQKNKEPDVDKLAEEMKLSKESVLYILNEIERKEKAQFPD